jgi:hypothetical protein
MQEFRRRHWYVSSSMFNQRGAELSKRWVFCCLMLAVTCTGLSADSPESRVRFYTGNLSVGYFMEYWGTGMPSPSDQATAEFCGQMKGVGVSAVCD